MLQGGASRNMSSEEIKSCAGCGGTLGAAMRFCPTCGKGQFAPPSGLWWKIAGTAVLFFAVPVGIKEGLTWKRGVDRPSKQFSAPEPDGHDAIDEAQVAAIKQELDAHPMDVGKMRELAAALTDKIRNSPEASPALVFETIDVLSKIVAIEPNDSEALLALADISFDRKAFTKALDFYQRYLKLRGDDAGARARYASTLTFLGRYDESIKELQTILAKDPKNFPALAYLAITYAQSGAVPKAKEVASQALAAAPSAEARERFSAFVTSLDSLPEKGGEQPLPSQGGAAGTPNGAQNGPSVASTGLTGFIAALKGNPVAGPKFVRHDVAADGSLRLFFREFPMAQMPPFAKEKFFSGLKRNVQGMQLTSVKRIVFVDDASGGEMETLAIGE